MSDSDSEQETAYKTPVKARRVLKEGKSRHKSHPSKYRHSLDDSSKTDSHNISVGYYSSPATTPVGRDNKVGWYNIHEKHVQQACMVKSELVLCGDSIVAGLSRYPNIWRKYFRPLKALNMGIGGDRTQHVLWRAENINLPATALHVVIHCGTNNIDRDSPRDIAEGVISVGLAFQERKQGLKIIVTGLLPRDLDVTYRREKIAQTNKFLKRFCQKLKDFYYMKQDCDWTLSGGKLNESLYYNDHLHLIETGNEKFAKSIISTWYRVKENTLVYSEEEGDDESSFIRERRVGEKRSKRESHSVNHTNNSRKDRKRKRSSSDDGSSPRKVHRSPFKWNNLDDSTSNKWSKARKWSKVLKNDNVDSLANRDGQVVEKNIDDKVEGTAKSIDISLDTEKRLAARREKFGIVGSSTKSNTSENISTDIKKTSISPSDLVRKIHLNQAKARQELSQKKQKSRQERRSLVGYDSPSSQEDIPTKSSSKIKKLFSDYASGSESE